MKRLSSSGTVLVTAAHRFSQRGSTRLYRPLQTTHRFLSSEALSARERHERMVQETMAKHLPQAKPLLPVNTTDETTAKQLTRTTPLLPPKNDQKPEISTPQQQNNKHGSKRRRKKTKQQQETHHAKSQTNTSKQARREKHQRLKLQADKARAERVRKHKELKRKAVAAAQARKQERIHAHEQRLQEMAEQRQKRREQRRELAQLIETEQYGKVLLGKPLSQLEEPVSEQELTPQQQARVNAAKSIPFWLANNREWMDHTLQILMPATTFVGDSLTHYKHAYHDSMASFYHRLSANELGLEDCLDRLAEVGFGNLKWSKAYRRMENQHVEEDRSLNRVRELKAEVANHEKAITALQHKVADAEARMKHLRDSQTLEIDKSKESQEDKSLSTRVVDKVVSYFEPNRDNVANRVVEKVVSYFEPKESPEKDTEPNQPKLPVCKADQREYARWTRLVHNWNSKMENTQGLLEAARAKLTANEAKLENQQNAMTKEEFKKAKVVVQEVMPDICKAMASHVHQLHSRMIDHYQILDAKTDLTKPYEWYQHARLDRRKIIYHGGPTNSGKTYTALQRLKAANTGLYLGPLRLLAAEIYETLTSQGVYTKLMTGQEKRELPFATHTAATVEIGPGEEEYDVVVIDEIQMIADPDRGYAWTRALLSARCKEIHVCGGLEAKEIIQKIAEASGDEFELRTYERFSELQVAENSLATRPKTLGSYKNVQPGDCVVAFSRSDIFAIKREIEKSTNYKCCVVYGSLPPQTRASQARLFNDASSGYDILVASDAIGMGLNLNIKRVIFNSIYKFDGQAITRLDHSAIKQISGRAGRRNSPYPNGEVTCRDPRDMEHLQKCMSTEIATIEKAGLLPTASHIELFADAISEYGEENIDLHEILRQFSSMATLKGDFFLCRQKQMQDLARILKDIPVPIDDKYILCMAPANTSDDFLMKTVKNFAKKLAQGEVSGVRGSRMLKPAKNFDHMAFLCKKYAEMELFLWLQYRFPPGNLIEEQAAIELREKAMSLINQGLSESDRLALTGDYIQRDEKYRREWSKKTKRRSKAELDNDEFLQSMEVEDL